MATDPLPVDPRAHPEFDRILMGYVEVLNLRGFVDPDEVRTEYPQLGPALLEDLETFVALQPAKAHEAPLGVLGDYTLRRQIGRGGMGVVYEAWQGSMDRRVALKVMPCAIAADTRAVARFIQEAQLAGKLSHPNIVHVHGMGVEQQVPYYAMDFVEGETLAQILARVKDVDPETETPFGKKDSVVYFGRLAEAFAEVADGLQHAHAKKVIHRDIKPSNLILDSEGRLRILDFGLARLEGQESLTQSGDLLGTPQYMSPEQARRKKVPVDHRTDVYSLGATMYEALCGRPPFLGKDYQDTLSQIIERDPVGPKKVNPRVPNDLETIVLKCLRKEAGERYGTAEALGQDLRRFVRGEVIEARAQPAWERILRRVRRQAIRLTLLSALTLLLVIAAVFVLFVVAERRKEVWATYQALVNEGIVQLELGLLTSSGESQEGETIALGLIYPGDLDWRAESYGRELCERAAEGLRQAVDLRPDRPEGYVHLSRALRALGRTDEALALLHIALRIAPGHLPAALLEAQHLVLASGAEGPQEPGSAATPASSELDAQWLAAHDAMMRSDWDAAEQACESLLRNVEVEPFVGWETELRLKRGHAAIKRKEYWTAIEELTILRRDWPRAVGPRLLLASAYYLMGDEDAARRTLKQALAVARVPEEALAVEAVCLRFGDQDLARQSLDWISDPGRRQLALARLLLRNGEYAAAAAAARQAIAAGCVTPESYSALANALGDTRRPGEARAALEEALKRFPGDPKLTIELGWLHRNAGDLHNAIALFESAIPRDPEEAYRSMGWAYWAYCDVERSAAGFTRSIELFPRQWSAWWGRGVLRCYTREWNLAFDDLVQSLLMEPRNAWRAVYLFMHSPAKKSHFDRHWDHINAALEEAARRGVDSHKHLGLLAVSYVHRSTPDLERALENANAAVVNTRGVNAIALSALAQVQHARHEPAKAVASLERALDVLERLDSARELLDGYRASVFPRLLTCASIDAFLERSGGTGDIGAARSALRADDPLRARYLEARLLELDGRTSGAAAVLEEVVAEDGLDEEAVILRLARLRAELGRRDEGLALIEERLIAPGRETLAAWAAWLDLAGREPQLSTRALLDRIDLAAGIGGPFGEDVRWALEALDRDGVLRIDCGASADRVDAVGRAWSRERFVDGGQVTGLAETEIRGTDDPLLYETFRWWYWPDFFVAPGLRIPLLRGRYEVTLHLLRPVVFPELLEKRTFDVLLEGEVVLSRYAYEAGLCVADPRTFTVEVKDGILDIVFRLEWRCYLSALEVKRLSGDGKSR